MGWPSGYTYVIEIANTGVKYGESGMEEGGMEEGGGEEREGGGVEGVGWDGMGVRTMQSEQPSQPKSVSFSLRKKEERMAQITTESAPIGVCAPGQKFRSQLVD